MQYSIEKHHIKTSDGWILEVKRYMPKNFLAPVLLLHGLGANSDCLDFYGDEQNIYWRKYSLAFHLLKHKFDVWVADLRGRKGSQTFLPRKEPLKYNWNVDTYIEHDLPDIVRYIRRLYYKKGEDTKLFLVGKSMGGMISYAYGMTLEGKNSLRGVVAIASPACFEKNSDWSWLLEFVKIFYPRRLSIPIPWFKLIEELDLMEKFIENMVNLENVEEKLLRKYMDKVFNNTISLKVFTQFVLFLKYADFCKFPRWPWLCDIFYKWPFLGKLFYPYSYKRNLWKFKLPILLIVGDKDKQAPVDDIWYIFQNIGSKDKKYVELPEFGHIDISFGDKAREKVFPCIYKWIKERV